MVKVHILLRRPFSHFSFCQLNEELIITPVLIITWLGPYIIVTTNVNTKRDPCTCVYNPLTSDDIGGSIFYCCINGPDEGH